MTTKVSFLQMLPPPPEREKLAMRPVMFMAKLFAIVTMFLFGLSFLVP